MVWNKFKINKKTLKKCLQDIPNSDINSSSCKESDFSGSVLKVLLNFKSLQQVNTTVMLSCQSLYNKHLVWHLLKIYLFSIFILSVKLITYNDET